MAKNKKQLFLLIFKAILPWKLKILQVNYNFEGKN